jgi:hypothetical protein
MTTSAARRARNRAGRRPARQPAASPALRGLARAGLVARGVVYLLIGWLAVRIAFGDSRQQADRTGALHTVAQTPFGKVLLWLLAAGFAGLAVWRLAEAAAGSGTGRRLQALGTGVLYGVVAYGTLKYALGLGAPQSGNKQAVDLTATALQHTGGKLVVIIIGFALIGGGLYLIWEAVQRRFLRSLDTRRMTARTRRAVEWLGIAGGAARGVVFGTAGVFLVIAAVRSQPGQAKGADSALRALAATPAGPWVLVLVAIGLIMFGAYSCCEARWFRAPGA